MITRYFDGEVPYPSPSERTPADEAIAELAEQTIADFDAQFEQFQFSRALETAWSLVAAVNKYIVENEPWAVAERDDKDSRARLATILYTSAEALRIVTALVHPVIPDATARIWTQLGLGDIRQLDLRTLAWGQLQLGTKLGKVEARVSARRQEHDRKDAADGTATLGSRQAAANATTNRGGRGTATTATDRRQPVGCVARHRCVQPRRRPRQAKVEPPAPAAAGNQQKSPSTISSRSSCASAR